MPCCWLGLAGRPARAWLPPLPPAARKDGPAGLVPLCPFGTFQENGRAGRLTHRRRIRALMRGKLSSHFMRQIPHRTLIVVAILTLLMAMLGCQGVSAKSDSTPPPPAAQLTASSASLSFGTVAVGTLQVLPETVTNNGSASLSLTTVSVTGTGFTVSGLSLPMVLAAGASTSFNVVFQPPAVVTTATG